MNFAEAAINPDAEAALQLCRAGFADSVSASFIPRWDNAGRSGDPTSQELLEVSCVAVGADPDARTLVRALSARQRGRDTEADRRAIRVATARRLAHSPWSEDSYPDDATYERYVGMRSGYGLTLEECALRLFMTPPALRLLITRVLRRNS